MTGARKRPVERLAQVLAAFRRGDSTVNEVAKRGGMNYETARRHVAALVEVEILEFKRWADREHKCGSLPGVFGWKP